MICPSCNTLNFRDYKYCRECGQKLPQAPATLEVTQMSPSGSQDLQVQALLDQAFASFEAGRTAEARFACQSALALRGESTAAHSLLGLIYEKEGKTDEAIHQFQIVLELNPDSNADRDHLKRLQDRRGVRRLASAAWLRRPVPLAAGAVAATLVLVAGLWVAAGALRPRTPAVPRVRPDTLRVMRGAPGAVPPSGPVRLPPPAGAYQPPSSARTAGTGGYGGQSAFASNGVGGIAPTVRMNSRMAVLAPSLYGSSRPSVSRPAPRRRTAVLAPAPVRVSAGESFVAVTPRSEGVPQLPDARSTPSDSEFAPPQPETAGRDAAAPQPASTTAATDATSDAGSGSFIRIRPLTGNTAPTADRRGESAPPSLGSRGAGGIGSAPDRRAEGTASSAPARGGGAAGGVSGPSLAEARLHQQNALQLWRQGDMAAAYQEYEYAAELYRLIAARRGPDAGAAVEGLRAAQQGMQASRGQR